jgi:hypothetical protein
MMTRDKIIANISSKHHQLTLGKVDDVRCLVDEDKSKCNKAINAAHDDPT